MSPRCVSTAARCWGVNFTSKPWPSPQRSWPNSSTPTGKPSLGPVLARPGASLCRRALRAADRGGDGGRGSVFRRVWACGLHVGDHLVGLGIAGRRVALLHGGRGPRDRALGGLGTPALFSGHRRVLSGAGEVARGGDPAIGPAGRQPVGGQDSCRLALVRLVLPLGPGTTAPGGLAGPGPPGPAGRCSPWPVHRPPGPRRAAGPQTPTQTTATAEKASRRSPRRAAPPPPPTPLSGSGATAPGVGRSWRTTTLCPIPAQSPPGYGRGERLRPGCAPRAVPSPPTACQPSSPRGQPPSSHPAALLRSHYSSPRPCPLEEKGLDSTVPFGSDSEHSL